VRTPEDYAGLNARIARRKPGQRCIHCHDVKMADLYERQQAGTFTRDLVFTYPPPSTVGIVVDPDAQDRVQTVKSGSFAAAAGLRPDDVLKDLDGQRILTAADFARVLECTPKEASLPLKVVRDGQPVQTTLRLPTGGGRRTRPGGRPPTWPGPTAASGRCR
jgi:hypothetical protein